jgi:hypothetical protein
VTQIESREGVRDTRKSTIGDFPGFAWLETSDEDSFQNRTAYMAHLTQHVQLPANYLMGDVQPMRNLFQTEIQGVGESRRISGTTDVVITESKNILNSAIRNNVEALLELKKPKNLQNKDHSPQMICEHVAASFLNRKHGVVSALTDLNDNWTFFWFADNQNGSVALHRLELKVKDESRAAGLAKYILENLNDVTRGDTLPTSFVDRLSFDDVMERILIESARKRARWDGGGGGDNAQAQDEKPHANPPQGGGLHQPPQGGGGGESPCGFEFEGNRDAGGGNQTTDMSRALSLLAPHSDVANELDLLDLVDEDEQYEIVRSFAAKHIVPYMRGQNEDEV